jgi:hypothetical protein
MSKGEGQTEETMTRTLKSPEVGRDVRILQGFTYSGRRGKLISKGERPDGREFYTVCLDISTGTGSCDREYYAEEFRVL